MTSLLKNCITLCLASCTVLVFAQEEVTAEQYAKEESKNGETFQVQGESVSPTSLLELTYQCAKPANQAAGDRLLIHGFSIVDPRDYKLRGPRALATALERAELNAQAGAAEALKGVTIMAASINTSTDASTSSGTVTGSGDEEQIMQSFSNQTVETLTNTTASGVTAFLRGGRTTGTKIISLGEQGMCVVVRYEVPFDQENYEPAQEISGQEDASDESAETEESESSDGGFEAPPPGSIGDF